MDGASAVAPLLRRLGRFANLTPAEIDQVRDLALYRKRSRSGTVLMAEGRSGAHFILSGWACSQRVLRDGRRQIFDFILPGEGFGFKPAAEAVARQTVVALTSVETVDASALLGASRDAAAGLWRAIRATSLDEEVRRLDHMIRLGRLTAPEKVAHFILEMQRRTGAADARSFPLPLTQETMADALGLSVVHLNRVLRQMRGANLAELRRGMAVLLDPRALAVAAVLTLADDRAAADA
jgi:CRP-like cAMP-binding protein